MPLCRTSIVKEFDLNLILLVLLVQVTAIVTFNLNKIIDVNYYPVETARRSNLRHRPIGIGVQGLADTFILLGMTFDSPEVAPLFNFWYLLNPNFNNLGLIVDFGYGMQAQQLNKDIFETIYYHALKASSELAAKDGPYETYNGCPVSKVLTYESNFV